MKRGCCEKKHSKFLNTNSMFFVMKSHPLLYYEAFAQSDIHKYIISPILSSLLNTLISFCLAEGDKIECIIANAWIMKLEYVYMRNIIIHSNELAEF